MPQLSIACMLPKGTYLPAGSYGKESHRLRIESPAAEADQGQSFVSMVIAAADKMDDGERETFLGEQSQRFIGRVNRLLRWHRAVGQSTAVHEMTMAEASPIVFQIAGTENYWGVFAAEASPNLPFQRKHPRKLLSAYGSDICPVTNLL